MEKPYLLQRCKTNTFEPSLLTGEYLSLDYMGSSEFEWGAVPKFQREINAIIDTLKIFTFNFGANSFHFFAKNKEEALTYQQYLVLIMAKTHEIRLKERASFDDENLNVWLDLTNLTIISREKAILKNLKKTIANSVKYMDERKAS